MATHVLTAPTTPSMTGSVTRSARGRLTVDMDTVTDMDIVTDMVIVMVIVTDMDTDMGTDKGMDMAMDMGREKQNKQRRAE